MNLSKSELPLTSFWDYIPGSRGKNGQSSRSTGKRKRSSVDAQSKVEPSGKGKKVGARASKDMTAVHRMTPKKPLRVYGVPRTSTSKEQHLALNSSSHPHKSQSVEVLDLTGSPSSSDISTRNSKQRRVEKAMPGDHSSSSDAHVQAFPTPPPTHFSRKSMTLPVVAGDPLSTAGLLLTPKTSVPRLKKRAKSSQLSKITTPSASTSPLASRQGTATIPLASSSPLSPCLIDSQPFKDDSNAEAVQQALRNAAPKNFSSDLVGRGSEGDDPFATSAVVLSSRSPPKKLPPRAITSVAHLEKTSPIAAFLPSPNRSRTMQRPHLTNLTDSPSKCGVESSQSQILLPFANSPRRKQQIVFSSQSQILLPFADSPRRMKTFFGSNSNEHDLGEPAQTVISSQSQIEKELHLSSPHVGLFALPKITSDCSNYVTGDVLPVPALRTPSTNCTSNRRSLHIASSPFSSPKYNSQTPKVTLARKPKPINEGDAAGDITIRPQSPRIQLTSPSHRRNQPSIFERTDPDDSATESESESVMIKFLTGRNPMKEQHPTIGEDRSLSPAEVNDSVTENSLVSNFTSDFSSPRIQPDDNHSQWSSEDTQALYLAGAPLSMSHFSLPIIGPNDSSQSIPPAVRDLMTMFDSDEDSYPSDFPIELRC